MSKFKGIAYFVTILLFVVACDIKDDIPYPIVYGQITEFEVEGQCGADGGSNYSTVIDKEARTITLYVNDTVNLSKLRVTKILTSGTTYNPDVNYVESPMVLPDSTSCLNYSRFPKKSFAKLTAVQDSRVDFTRPVKFVIRTYQDYVWTVTVKQIVQREIEVENQVGKAVIDPYLCNAVIYVKSTQNLKNIKVKKFSLGGLHGRVKPNPTTYDTYDFSEICMFGVTTGWGEKQVWQVVVHQTEASVQITANAFVRNNSMTISGEKPNGITPLIEYKQQNESSWVKVPDSVVDTTPTTYTATIEGLAAATTYQYRVTAGESVVDNQEITTVAVQELPNNSFDDWSIDASNSKLFYPWAAGSTSYWDTGNRGATTVGSSNSIPTDDTSTGRGKAAYLESKWIVIKFAAGNIFTGSYLKTDGTNGILGFGRPFTAFPKKLSFDYKYKSVEINKCGDDGKKYLIGRPDSCNIYIALWHIDEGKHEVFQGEKYPLVIRTKPGVEQNLFSANDPRVIAYGQFTKGETIDTWTSETININYKNTNLAPTHILVVASSSKYGDFFTGGVGSTLVLDNMKLIYE